MFYVAELSNLEGNTRRGRLLLQSFKRTQDGFRLRYDEAENIQATSSLNLVEKKEPKNLLEVMKWQGESDHRLGRW